MLRKTKLKQDKKHRGKKKLGDEVESENLPLQIRSRKISFTVEPQCQYRSFLEVVRNSVTGRFVTNQRITFPTPSPIKDDGSMTREALLNAHFVDLDLKTESGNEITLRVFGHNVYASAVERKSERGTWYCFRQDLATYIGGVYVGYGENYEDLGGLGGVKIGFIPVENAINTLSKCSINDMKRPLVTLIVNMLEAARFPEFGDTISDHMDASTAEVMNPDWESTFHSWGARSAEVAAGLGNINDHPPVDTTDWHTEVVVNGNEADNVEYDGMLALLLSSRVYSTVP